MSSTTRLMVLGVIRIFQPIHGYDVRRELISWHAHDWGNVAPGSIYNALKSLTKEGLIEIVGTDQVGGRPERTTYRLTLRGEQDLMELLRDTWWKVRMPVDPLVPAIALLGFMPREEAIAALEARAAAIRGQLEHAEYQIASVDNVETPDHVREMLRLISARVGAELAWAKAFVALLRKGEYSLLGDRKWQPKPSATARTGASPRTGEQRARRITSAVSKPVARASKTAPRPSKPAKPKATSVRGSRKR